jgi:arabinofuranosyltransferase
MLVLQVLVVAVAVAAVAPGVWRTRWVQDDAYVSFRYARNMVEGHGLVYNAGEWVEGYTNFLWTMISALPLALGADDPLPAMHLLGMGLWLGTYGLLVLLGVILAGRGVLIGPLIALPLLAVWSYNQWFLGGMETGLVSFLSVLLLLLVALQDLKRPRRAALLGLTVAALLLTRPDTAPFIAGVALAGLLCQWRWLARRPFWQSWLPALVLPVIVVFIPYTGWRLGYYGDVFPNTYYAKMAYLPAWDRGREYLETFFRVYDLRPFLLLPLIAVPLARTGAARRFLAGAAFGSAATALYVWRLGGDFMEWRFLMPVTGVFVPAIGIAAYLIAERLAGPALSGRGIADEAPPTAAAGLVALALALAVVAWLGLSAAAGSARARHEMVPGQEHIPSLAKYAGPEYAWDEVGRACDAVLPDDLRIATTAAGMLPYFARNPTLDLHGLTSREIARTPLKPDEARGRLGHERVLKDREVMRKLGVGAFVHTERLSTVPLALASNDRQDEVTVSLRIDERRFFDVDLFDPEPSLLEALRRRDDVVFSDPSRLLPKEQMVTHQELLQSHRLVDRLDVNDPSSEQAHEFAELRVAERMLTRVTHEKLLGYDLPGGPLPLRDEGRRIFGQARWVVEGVAFSRDLVMVIRHDRTSCSRYWVRVNGRRAPQLLAFECGPEAWAELRFDIPREMLAEGRNTIALDPEHPGHAQAEIYHVWLLQRNGD